MLTPNDALLGRLTGLALPGETVDDVLAGASRLYASLHSKPQEDAKTYRALSACELEALPTAPSLLQGIFPKRGTGAIVGPSGSGKTFLALDLASSIPEGGVWFGHRLKSAPVVYVALEGEAGLRQRVRAWKEHRGRDLPDDLYFVLQSFDLGSTADIAALVNVIPDGAVVIIDTLNRASPGADENDSRDMSRTIEAVGILQSETRGLVLLVHHTGKDASKGMRGHSSLFASLDGVIEVSRDGDRRTWRVSKSKDGADGEEHPFRLEVVELGEDEFGAPVTSCVVNPDDTEAEVRRVKVPQGGNQRLVYDALVPLFKIGRVGIEGAPPGRPAIELEVAVMSGSERLTCPTDKRTSRARDALTGMINKGVMGFQGGWIWLN